VSKTRQNLGQTRQSQRQIARRRQRQRQFRRRRTVFVGVVALVGAAIALFATSGGPTRAPSAPKTRAAKTRAAALFALPRHLVAGPDLAPGSSPSALPADLLIADRTNSRLLVVDPTGKVVWQFPRPGDLAPGQSFLIPDDAFFTPNGKDIVATEEDDSVVSEIDVATHHIVWRYGSPGHPGSGLNQLSNPDDAMMLPSGYVVLADIKNCSLLVLRPPSHVPFERIGENTTACLHAPPLRWGSPNGIFAMRDGTFLVTEINGDWVDDITLAGAILHWSTNPPGVAYPSDSNEVAPDRFLTADYSSPGQAVEFDSHGKLLWRYGPSSGPGALNQPSLCLPVPKRTEIICNDDMNDRVVAISTVTNRIVWQYGHDGIPGRAPGYLDQPDGIDLVPPYSFIVAQRSTVGKPSRACAPSDPNGTCQFGLAAGS
jgi:outer membrane protein assembly factor BamB